MTTKEGLDHLFTDEQLKNIRKLIACNYGTFKMEDGIERLAAWFEYEGKKGQKLSTPPIELSKEFLESFVNYIYEKGILVNHIQEPIIQTEETPKTKILEKLDCYVKECKRISETAKNRCMDSYADFGGTVGRIYDWQIADYVKKHLRFIDRFNLKRVTSAVMYGFCILSKNCDEPNSKKKNWKFYKDI